MLIKHVVVKEEQRVDKLLTKVFPEYSRSYLQSLIEASQVTCNEKVVKKRFIPTIGSTIKIALSLPFEPTLQPEDIPLEILFEDESILCVNKPAGMVTHPAPGHYTGTFAHALLHHCPCLEGDDLRPGIVHRLDKDTSGVLLAAKTIQAHQHLTTAFSERKISKEYLAITLGVPNQKKVDCPIGRNPYKRKEMTIVKEGKEAVPFFEVLKVYRGFALIKARPVTGRTHQIRVHLKWLKTPILGDKIYGFEKINQRLQVKRQLLHAHELEFNHPLYGDKIKIKAPLPLDFELFVKTMD